MLYAIKNHGPAPLMIESENGELTRIDGGEVKRVLAPKRLRIIGKGRASYSCNPV